MSKLGRSRKRVGCEDAIYLVGSRHSDRDFQPVHSYCFGRKCRQKLQPLTRKKVAGQTTLTFTIEYI